MLIPLKLLQEHPLQQQLYDQLRALIVSARLAAGMRMPSSRVLADQFSISRMTVLLTYERLIAEGYLEAIPAVGTFVARPPTPPANGPAPPADVTGAVPYRARTLRATAADSQIGQPEIGQPDPSLFPIARWRALMRRTLERLGTHPDPSNAAGNAALRGAIARWLSSSRGTAVRPEQVILAGGRRQALHLATHLLLSPGVRVVVEDPCEDFAADLYTSAQAEIVRVPVDADGICTNRLPTGPARLVHVTPQHQGPLGVTLSAERRRQLLEWAAQSSATVLEEESQGEFRYAAVDAPPLMSLDREGRVLHVGCFASTLGPWLTLGYLVVPQWLVPKALAARRLIDDHALWLEEDALAELLDTGAYARHVQRLRKVYHRRRDALIESMQHHFGGNLRLGGSHAGLHLAWRVPEGLGSSSEVATLARRAGLQAAALPGAPVVLLGFAMPAERLIAAGVAQLAGQLETGVQAVSALFGAD